MYFIQMDNIKLLQKIIKDTLNALKPTDIRFATITSLKPLTITLESVQLSITEPSVVALESTKELVIDNVEHDHQYYDSDTSDGASRSQTRIIQKALTNIQCYLGGVALGKDANNRIIIRKGLAANDKVAVIRAGGGQTYLIIGRI